MTALQVTAFGAVLADPVRTASVLRAMAARATDLFAVGQDDLVASVLLVHGVLVLGRFPTLDRVSDPSWQPVLFAGLARSAGAGRTGVGQDDVDRVLDVAAGVDVPAAVLAQLDVVARWAVQWATPEQVVARIAADVGPSLGHTPALAVLCALLEPGLTRGSGERQP